MAQPGAKPSSQAGHAHPDTLNPSEVWTKTELGAVDTDPPQGMGSGFNNGKQ